MACEKHSAGEQPQLLDPRSGCDAEAVISIVGERLYPFHTRLRRTKRLRKGAKSMLIA